MESLKKRNPRQTTKHCKSSSRLLFINRSSFTVFYKSTVYKCHSRIWLMHPHFKYPGTNTTFMLIWEHFTATLRSVIHFNDAGLMMSGGYSEIDACARYLLSYLSCFYGHSYAHTKNLIFTHFYKLGIHFDQSVIPLIIYLHLTHMIFKYSRSYTLDVNDLPKHDISYERLGRLR